MAAAVLAVAAVAGCGSSGKPQALRDPGSFTATAPASYAAVFRTTKGSFTITVTRADAPVGADRFYNLVRGRFFDGVEFFRVVKGFVVQFGISPDPAVSSAWQNATIEDDPVRAHNVVGSVTFADSGPNSRTTQMFINLANNSANLDGQGFSPIGKVTSGMAVVQKLYSGYGEAPSAAQGQIAAQGNAFLKKHFPKLDAILSARIR